jgi:hypothetical protein
MMSTNAQPTDRSTPFRGRRAILAAVLLFLVGFTISYSFVSRLDALGVIDQYNILFDSDPNQALAAISHGWGRNYKHWNLATFFSIPIRLMSKPAALLSAAEEMEIRMELGLLVAPLLSALTGPLVFGAGLFLGLRLRYALLLALVNQVCTSRVVFGSVPESFALSAFAIALFLWLGARDIRNSSPSPRLAWVVAGVFGFGVTVTNLVSFCFSWMLSRYDLSTALRPALASTARMAALVVAINMAIFLAAAFLFSESVTRIVQRAGEDPYYGGDFLRSLAELPFAIGYTLAGPLPAVVPEPIAGREDLPIRTMFNYARVPKGSLGSLAYLAFLGACFVLGAAGWYQAGGQRRTFGILCVLLVFLNSTPHLLYRGLDLFLYSQQWQVPLIFLVGGIFFLRPEWEGFAEATMVAVLCVCAWQSYSLVEFVLRTLNRGSS